MKEKTIVLDIDEKEIKEKQRYDLIFKSINLAFLELGIKDLQLHRLVDKDGKIRIEVIYTGLGIEQNKLLRSQQCDVYNMNGLPCEHMDKLVKALDKMHFEGQIQDLL